MRPAYRLCRRLKVNCYRKLLASIISFHPFLFLSVLHSSPQPFLFVLFVCSTLQEKGYSRVQTQLEKKQNDGC